MVLARSTHAKYVQHLLGHVSIQLTLANLATKCATHSGTQPVGEPGLAASPFCGILPFPRHPPSPPSAGVP